MASKALNMLMSLPSGGGLPSFFNAQLLDSISFGNNLFQEANRNSDGTILLDTGFLRLAQTDEMRFWGARCVYNLVDFHPKDWTGSNIDSIALEVDDPFGGTSAIRVIGGSGSNSPTFYRDIANTTVRDIRNSMWMRFNSGNVILQNLQFYTGSGSASSNVYHKVIADNPGQWVRVCGAIGVNAGAVIRIGFTCLTTAALNIDIAFCQTEDVTDQQDQSPGYEVWPFYGNTGPNHSEDFTQSDQTWEGTEIVPNGNSLTVTTLGTPRFWVDQEPLRIGHKYEVSCAVSGFSGTGFWFLLGNTASTVMTANGFHHGVFECTLNSKIGLSGIAASGTISNIRIKEIDNGNNNVRAKYSTTTNNLEVDGVEVISRTNAADHLLSDHTFITGDPWTATLATYNAGGTYYSNQGAATATIQHSDTNYQANRTYLATVTIDKLVTGNVSLSCAGQVIVFPRKTGTHQIYFTPTTVSTAPSFLLSSGQAADNIRVSRFSLQELGADLELDGTLGFLPDEGFSNIHTNSNDFTLYTPVGMTIAGNDATGLFARDTADKITETAATSQHYIASPVWTTSGGGTYTYSVHVEYSNRRFIELVYADSTGANGVYAIFDMLTNSVHTAATALGTGTATEEHITVLRNGFVRLAVTGSHAGTSSRTYVIHCDNSPSHAESYLGSTGIITHLDGAQLELQAYPGSYTPTVGSPLSMTEDSLSYVSDVSTGPISCFAEFTPLHNKSDFSPIISINEDGLNFMELFGNSQGIRAQMWATTQQSLVQTTGTMLPGATYKCGAKFNTNMTALYMDGTERGTRDTVATASTGLINIDVGSRAVASGFVAGAPVRKVFAYDVELSDTKMELKTT